MPTSRRTVLATCGLVMFATFAHGARADEDKALTHARALLKTAILVDGHNDLPWAIRLDKKAPGDVAAYDLNGTVPGQTDLKRLENFLVFYRGRPNIDLRIRSTLIDCPLPKLVTVCCCL